MGEIILGVPIFFPLLIVQDGTLVEDTIITADITHPLAFPKSSSKRCLLAFNLSSYFPDVSYP